MSVMETTTVTNLVTYSVNDSLLAQARAACVGLSADTPKGYEEVRMALASLRGHRVNIEKRRVELKADALDYGRRVDAEAKRLTSLIVEIEEPLSQKKHDVDYEKARIKAEAEAKKQAELEAKIRAEREAEEARLQAVREVEEARLQAVREVEEARLAAERVQLEAERAALAEERRQADDATRVLREAQEAAQAAERARLAQVEAAQRVEREAIEAERRAVAAEREKAERVEFERQAKIKAEAEAVAKAERDRIAAAEQAAKLAALAPDIEKVRAFASAICALPVPKGRTRDAKAAIADAVDALAQVATDLELFGVV